MNINVSDPEVINIYKITGLIISLFLPL